MLFSVNVKKLKRTIKNLPDELDLLLEFDGTGINIGIGGVSTEDRFDKASKDTLDLYALFLESKLDLNKNKRI